MTVMRKHGKEEAERKVKERTKKNAGDRSKSEKTVERKKKENELTEVRKEGREDEERKLKG